MIKRPSITWARDVMARGSRMTKESFAQFLRDYKAAPENEVANRLVFFAKTLANYPRCPEWARERAWACLREYQRAATCMQPVECYCPRCGEHSAQRLQVSLVMERHASITRAELPAMLQVVLNGCEHARHEIRCMTCELTWPGSMFVQVMPGFAPEPGDQQVLQVDPDTDPSKMN